MPTHIPSVDFTTWMTLSYPEIVLEICKIFIDPTEIPHDKLREIILSQLQSDLVATKRLSDDCSVLELFHGSTLAFKDLAMSCTARFLDYFLQKRQRHLNIIVSTSGDTGAAAIQAIRGSPHMDVFVMYPLGRVTEIQELQMTTMAATAENVHLFGLTGTSDDGDEVMKALFADKEFAERNDLSNVNSINWSRILIQIAPYFYAYFQSGAKPGQVVEIAVPTGAAGNLIGGCIARAMGLPVRLVACTNDNDVIHQMIQTGVLMTGSVKQTLASAMDIQMPYNIERILHVLSNGDTALSKEFANAVDGGKALRLGDTLHTKVKETFHSHTSSNAGIKQTIKTVFEQHQYVVCPHTATALHYYSANQSNSRKSAACVCIATASPDKFTEVLDEAGIKNTGAAKSLLNELRVSPQKVLRLENRDEWVAVLRKSIEDHRKLKSRMI
ncbi:threonine synthase-like 2 isoform X2 [Paramacrobiotus metropolitanus]|nr:threonine synthase-like 2 isoform X2 [Paramacrobiotus metropolitanus]